MATYKEIQEYVKKNNGYTPKSCWIAHCKELFGLNPEISPRRKEAGKRVSPCPEKKQKDIKEAFLFFGMLDK